MALKRGGRAGIMIPFARKLFICACRYSYRYGKWSLGELLLRV